MKSIFKYLNDNKVDVLSEKINFNGSTKEDIDFKYLIDFKIDYKLILDLNFPEVFFSHSFFGNNQTLKSNSDLQNLLVPYDEPDFIEFNLIIKQKLNDAINHLFFYSNIGVEKFIIEFSKIKSNKLPAFSEKINLETYITNGNWPLNHSHSSIFQINQTEDSSLTSKTLSYLETLKKKELVIGLLPKFIHEDHFNLIPLLPLVKSLLSTIANDTNKNCFYFKGRYNLKVDIDKEYNDETMINHFKGLNNLYYYIYTNDVSADQKKTFVRKAICNNLSKDDEQNISEFGPTYFDDIFKDANYLFETFENGEVSVFLKEKKEILKEYMSLSKDILTNINDSKNNLHKSFRTLVTILLVNFGLRLLPRFNSDNSDFEIVSKIFFLIAIFYIVFALTIFFFSDYPLYKLVKEKRVTFEKQFKFVSSKTDELKNDYKELIIKDLTNYKNLLCLILTIYLLILLSLILLLFTI